MTDRRTTIISARYGVIRKVGSADVVSPWLDATEAAAYCGRNDAEWINKHARGGKLPHSTGKGKRMFHVADLDDLLCSGSDQADPEEPAAVKESKPTQGKEAVDEATAQQLDPEDVDRLFRSTMGEV